MATAKDLERMAIALAGTTAAPHFDRIAYKVARTYATTPPDGLTANLKLTSDQQQLKCLTAPNAFKPIDNAWGRQGWTVVTLSMLTTDELADALELAWRNAQPKPREIKARDAN